MKISELEDETERAPETTAYPPRPGGCADVAGRAEINRLIDQALEQKSTTSWKQREEVASKGNRSPHEKDAWRGKTSSLSREEEDFLRWAKEFPDRAAVSARYQRYCARPRRSRDEVDVDGRINSWRSICAPLAAANVDLDCLFETEIETGNLPPEWIVSALSRQAAQLGVEIQYAVPKRVAEELPGSAKVKRQIDRLSHLTPRTEDALVPAVRRTAKAAKAIRLFVMGETRSNKKKARQIETLNKRLGALRRLVKMDGVIPDGVLLYRLFEGQQVVCLPSDDETFADCLSAIGRHPPWALPTDLAVALGPKREEFLVSLLFVEKLANKCIARRRMKLRQKRGRPPNPSCVRAQLRCAVIIRVLRAVWPGLALSENEMCERLWQTLGGEPHCRDSDSGRYDVWRKEWTPLAGEDTEIRRDVEYTFFLAGGADCRERLDPH